jgi:ABC-2 type transport system permease protein
MTVTNDATPGPGTAPGGPVSTVAQAAPVGSTRRAFRAILWRDIFVTGKEFWVFLIQVGLQPLFMLFVFAKVLGELNYVTQDYGHLLLPGIVALTAFLTALQAVSFPLVMEFSFTREIEDRLLAPLPTQLVAIEKLVVAVMRAIVAAAVIFPIGALVLGSAPWRVEGVPLLVVVLLLGAWVGAGIGLTMGTLVPPARISVIFAAVFTPLLFTGATQYPWPSLDSIRWFQIVTALNPLTYCSEGVRAALVPDVPHIQPWICIGMLIFFAILFTATGIKGFLRRAIS